MTGSFPYAARWGPLLLFGLLAAGVVATEHTIVHGAAFGRYPALGPAVAFDLLTEPNLLLTFAEPQVVRGPYGLRRTVRSLVLYVDELQRLLRHLGRPTPAPLPRA